MNGELDFIESLRALATHPAARGLEDDAAVLEVGNETLIITHDAMVEGVHFLPDQDMSDVGWKLAATNLSDLAAKGAVPVGALLSYSLGADRERFIAGLSDALDRFELPLLGGDTVSSNGPRHFGMTAIGRASHTPVPSRSGARSGDAVYVTGAVGAAMLGFEALRDQTGADSSLFRRPIPLIEQGRLLAPFVSAIMDVSDGLLLDASRIAAASGVSVNIDPASVPLAADEDRRMDALRWGDDYQLLFTADQAVSLPVEAWKIGTVCTFSGSDILLNGEAPSPDFPLGFTHSSG